MNKGRFYGQVMIPCPIFYFSVKLNVSAHKFNKKASCWGAVNKGENWLKTGLLDYATPEQMAG
jgi:hypothetical protein